MIDLYTWSTPNGRKVSIMLEECGLPYRVHRIDIGRGDQFTSDYVAISPNSKIPAIVDHEGPRGEPNAAGSSKPLALMESGLKSATITQALETAASNLVQRQQPDGFWPRERVAGIFFDTAGLHYDLYRLYFPLWALNRVTAGPTPGGSPKG